VLSRSFLFLAGIGPVRENRLWRRGVSSWAQYRDLPRVQGIRPRLKAQHDEVLALAEERMGRDPAFFAHLLPTGEHWRAFGQYGEGAAYVDIETTGDRDNQVTVVGVRHRGKSRAFVKGIDYSPEAVSRFLGGATCLVTFNGASFDLPVLQRDGVTLPAVPHVDLRLVFGRIGLTGGLKKIEEDLGCDRDPSLAGLSGWDAVKLWRRWETRGDQAALDRLVAYNLADFENLEPLAHYACETLTLQTLRGLRTQTRLPVQALPAGAPAGP
jgi:uncharacterized protein YprB with RNaseH-like and TPR domain